ncbi:MAG: hypothetical protein J7L96_06555, partial [Bacteroidales bacterium]|nr:hypothetical protein [Bacteroidales bacterium]
MRIIVSLFMMAIFSQFSFGQYQSFFPGGKTEKPLVFKELLKAYDHFEFTTDLDNQKGWKAYARWIEFNRERLNPGGEVADPAIFLSEAIKVSDEKKEMARQKTGLGWSPVGPFEKPGTYSNSPSYGMARINCVTFHPTDPDIYWVGIAQGGVWKTTDGGESYTPLTDDLPLIRISDIAVDRKNPDVLYISVCDYAYIGVALNTDARKRHTHYGLGVYKTIDGGVTWNPTGLSFDESTLDATLIRRVLISPDDSDVLLAAGVSGIYKSTDGGDSWTHTRDDMIWDIE